METTEQSDSPTGADGLTTEEMMQQASVADWAFETVWQIDEGESYPTLRVFSGPEVYEGDANGDNVIHPLNAGFVLARFGCDVGAGDADCDAADANSDGQVDRLDVGFVLARFGGCE